MISALIAVVCVGLAGFAYAQNNAPPPSDSKIVVCPNGEAEMIVFDQNGDFVAAYYGTVDSDGFFTSAGQFDVYPGYVCSDADKTDCRFVQNNETFYFCGSIGGGTSGIFFKK